MKYTPEDNILSSKAKQNKKISDTKPYFENTHQVFTPSWINYKNPSLKSEEQEEEEGEEKSGLKGMSLLKRVYGGACWKGYEQFGMKEKDGRKVPNCVPVSKSIKGGGKMDKQLERVADNYQDIINHLEEHQQEGVGDPKDTKQSKMLKNELKRVNEIHLIPANKIKKSDPLYKVSNPKEVQKKANEIYGKDAIVYKSSNPKKKYQIQNKNTGKWVHFGDATMEDYTKHLDFQRRKSYLSRSLGIKGKWQDNPYSPNYLSIMLLW